jgi:hypothetical protein
VPEKELLQNVTPLDMQDDVLNKKRKRGPGKKPRVDAQHFHANKQKFSDLDIKLLWHKHLGWPFAQTRHYNRLRTEIESQGLTDQEILKVLQVRTTMGCT